jgi:hypothetical protein
MKKTKAAVGSKERLTVGRLANAANVGVETIRYYQATCSPEVVR